MVNKDFRHGDIGAERSSGSRQGFTPRGEDRESAEGGRTYLLVFIGLVLVALPLLWWFDPMQSAWMPKCIVKSLTGLQCPGCGITRATHAVLHGRFAEALSYNFFFIFSIPYLLAVGLVSYVPALYRRERLRRVILGVPLALTYVVLFMIWFVVRNLLGI